MKSIFKKSLTLVMVTGMVVAPAHADVSSFCNNNPRLAKFLGIIPKVDAPVVPVVKVPEVPVVVVPAPSVPAAAVKAPSVSWTDTLVSRIGSALSTANAWTLEPLHYLTRPMNNRLANYVQSKTGWDNKGVTIAAKTTITLGIATAVGLAAYYGYKYFKGGSSSSVSTSNSKRSVPSATPSAPTAAQKRTALETQHGSFGSRTTIKGKFDAVKASLTTFVDAAQAKGFFTVEGLTTQFRAVETGMNELLTEMSKESALAQETQNLRTAYATVTKALETLKTAPTNGGTAQDSAKKDLSRHATDLQKVLKTAGLNIK